MAMSRIARSSLRQQLASNSRVGRVIGKPCENIPEIESNPCLLTSFTTTSIGKHLTGTGAPNGFVFVTRSISMTPHYQYPLEERVEYDSELEADSEKLPGLEPTKPGEKPRVVVLGTGWAGCRFLKGLNTKIYDTVCISPRNHMVFTPLLASTCVGTLEFRSVAEPVSCIQTALSDSPDSYFYLAKCTGINTDKHEVYCEASPGAGLPSEPYRFKVSYDKLVIAAGADPLTFNIKGVKENALFLREVNHAQEIRKKLLLNLMLSENPDIKDLVNEGLSEAGSDANPFAE